MKQEIMILADYTQEITFSLEEMCDICGIEITEAQDFVRYDIIIPHSGKTIRQQSFDMMQLQRLRKALRLQRDLELNHAGIALVLQLLSEIEELRAMSDIYQKHIEK